MTPTLGSIITNHTVRKWLYGIYGLVAIAAAAAQVAYASLHVADPSWLVAAIAVIAFLAIPFAGLAAANTPPSTPAVSDPVTAPVATMASVPAVIPAPSDPVQPAAVVPPAA